MFLAGQQFRAGIGLSTAHASLDWETYSEAGYVWNPHIQKWGPPRGVAKGKGGLPIVGVYNYVTHPTFEILSCAYDLLDGCGVRHWVPRLTEFGLADEPHDLVAHVAAGRVLQAFNVGFEWSVWEYYCVPKFGWPGWPIENARCSMDRGKAFAYPPNLEAASELVLPPHLQKDKAGHALVRKLTVPKNPSAPPKPRSAVQAAVGGLTQRPLEF